MEKGHENQVTREGRARGTLGSPSCVVPTGRQISAWDSRGERQASHRGRQLSFTPACLLLPPLPKQTLGQGWGGALGAS